MMLSFVWKTDHFYRNLISFEQETKEYTTAELKKVAIYVVDDIKGNWSPVKPSKPYTPPAIDTGAYNESIRIEQMRDVTGRFISAWRINLNTDLAERPRQYSAALEFGTPYMARRPHILPALRRAEKRFNGLIYRVSNA